MNFTKKNHQPTSRRHKNSRTGYHGPNRKLHHKKLGLEALEDRRLLSTVFSATLDTNPGWTTTGQWAFGHPLAGGGSHGNPDPSSGYTGSNVYGVNLSGDYSTTAGGPYYVTTPAINCANYTNVALDFARWLNTDYQSFATATIEVSNNGTTWSSIYANSSSAHVTEYSWQLMHYDISTYANNQATVYIRWGYKIGSGAYPYSGWNIDDITVTGDPTVPPLTLSIAAPSISEAAGAHATTGTVTRNTSTADPLVVSLVCSDTSEATAPSSVTIPANQTSVTFDIAAVDDIVIDGTQTVTITANANVSDGTPVGLDSTFGSGGIASVIVKTGSSPAYNALAVQPDGKILTATDGNVSTYAWRITRLNGNGSLDTSFGTNGSVDTTFSTQYPLPDKIIVQPDGKILVGGRFLAGTNLIALARYNSNGSLDTSFGTSGIAKYPGITGKGIVDMVQRPDGTTLLALGFASPASVACINSDGSLYTAFGSSGIKTFTGFNASPGAIALMADGRFLLASDFSSNVKILRANADGSLDTTFGTAGIQTVNFGLSAGVKGLALDSAGRIVFGGYVWGGANNTGDFAVGRLNSNGSLDTSFSGDGIAVTNFPVGLDDYAYSMALQGDDKIVLSGFTETSDNTNQVALVRYKPDGSLDASFDGEGMLQLSINSATAQVANCSILQADGKLVILAGWGTDWRIARFRMGVSPVSATATLDVADNDLLTSGIGDIVWNDTNANGLQDAGETGIAGWEVYLDTNANGQWDSGEPKTATDAAGHYAITGLAPGTYIVAQVQRAGWEQTFPAAPASHTVALGYGQNRHDIDFGNRQLPSKDLTVVVSVDGEAQDSEPNGIFETLNTTGTSIRVGNYMAGYTLGDLRGLLEFDLSSLAGEGTVVGASLRFYVWSMNEVPGTVYHYSVYGYVGDGNISLSDATASSLLVGTFEGNRLGTFTVPIDAAFIESLRGPGKYAGLIVRMAPVENSRFVMTSLEGSSSFPERRPSLLLTTQVPSPGKIQNAVWDDLDADGIQETGEPGIAGAGVELYRSVDLAVGNADDTLIARVVTDATGHYVFNGLSNESNYYLTFRAPVGFVFTAKDAPGSTDDNDSDVNSAGVSEIFTVSTGQTDSSHNAGLVGSAPAFGWAIGFGGPGTDAVTLMDSDSEGNVYLAGALSGTADLDNGPGVYNLTSMGNMDILLAKYSSQGALIWAKQIGGTGNDLAYTLELGNDDSIHIAGYFETIVDFDPGPNTYELTSAGFSDIYIAKFDPDGDLNWAHGIGGVIVDYAYSLAVDAAGNVFSTGKFYGTADFDPGPGTFSLTSAGTSDIYISKWNASGSFVWAKQIGGTSYDAGYSIALDDDGYIYSTGEFSTTVYFGPGPGATNLVSSGSSDIFISKLNQNGDYLWTKRIGGIYDDRASSLALGTDGSILTTGYFQGTVDFDPNSVAYYYLTSSGSTTRKDIFVSKLDAAGNFVWAKRMGGTEDDAGAFILPAPDGGILTTGTFKGTADFDPGTGVANLTSAGGNDVFISKLDASGSISWVRRLGGTGEEIASALTLGSDASLFYYGGFSNTVNFNPGAGAFNLVSNGGYDAFLVKTLERPPADIQISSNDIAEQQPIGTVVGLLSTTDPDPGDAFAYTLVSGSGSGDNAYFAVNASGQLITTAILDFETKSTYSIRVRTTDHGGMWYEKALTIRATDVPESLVIGAANWTVAGLTMQLGGDGKLHIYATGTTTDVVPPHVPTSVTGIDVTGRNTGDVLTVDSMGTGVPSLSIHNVTLSVNQNNAIAAGAAVTIDGGVLNYNGHSETIGNLIMKNGGQATVTAINNTTTTVESGTLTATSVVCDTLTIGSASGAFASSTAANSTNDTSTATAPILVADCLLVGNAAVTSTSNDSPAIVAQPGIGQTSEAPVLANPAASAPLAARAPRIVPSALVIVNQAIATPTAASAPQSPIRKEQQNSEFFIAEPLSLELAKGAYYADHNLTARFDYQHSFSNTSFLTEGPKDSVYDELANSLALTKNQPSIALPTSQDVRSFALQSLVREYQQDFAIASEDSELLFNKHSRNQDKLAQKPVDEFHPDLAGAIE